MYVWPLVLLAVAAFLLVIASWGAYRPAVVRSSGGLIIAALVLVVVGIILQLALTSGTVVTFH